MKITEAVTLFYQICQAIDFLYPLYQKPLKFVEAIWKCNGGPF